MIPCPGSLGSQRGNYTAGSSSPVQWSGDAASPGQPFFSPGLPMATRQSVAVTMDGTLCPVTKNTPGVSATCARGPGSPPSETQGSDAASGLQRTLVYKLAENPSDGPKLDLLHAYPLSPRRPRNPSRESIREKSDVLMIAAAAALHHPPHGWPTTSTSSRSSSRTFLLLRPTHDQTCPHPPHSTNSETSEKPQDKITRCQARAFHKMALSYDTTSL